MSQFVTPGFSISLPAPPNALSTGLIGPVVNQTNLSMSSYLPNLVNSTIVGTLGPPPLYADPSKPYVLVNQPLMNNAQFFPVFSSTLLSSVVGPSATPTAKDTNLNNLSVFPLFSQ